MRKNSSRIPLTFLTLLGGPVCLFAIEIKVPIDHPTIQQAITAAGEGDLVLVEPGIYRERLVLKKGIEVRSVGSEKKGGLGLRRAEETIIDGGSGEDDSPGVTMAEAAILDGFTITNVGKYDESVWQKHWDEKGASQAHEQIGQFGTPGIAVNGVDCVVTNNIVHHNGGTGIAIRGDGETTCAPTIANNFCYRNMAGGIGSMNGSTPIIVENTCFENFYAGIGHERADSLVIRNLCYRNIRAGIGISEGASPVVRQNRCYGNRRAGIGIRSGDATRPIIEDNDCYENEMAGIASEEDAAPTIRGNRCHHNRLAGIGGREHSFSIIVDNHCYENEQAGIGIDSSAAYIIRNRIERNQTAGIGIEGKSEAVVLENICEENRLVAIGIPNGGEAIIQTNTLVRSEGMPPFVAILGGSRATMSDNSIEGGGVAGVLIEGTLVATGNKITGKDGGAGFLARENSEVILSGNRISGYRTPVKDAGAKSLVLDDQSSRP